MKKRKPTRMVIGWKTLAVKNSLKTHPDDYEDAIIIFSLPSDITDYLRDGNRFSTKFLFKIWHRFFIALKNSFYDGLL